MKNQKFSSLRLSLKNYFFVSTVIMLAMLFTSSMVLSQTRFTRTTFTAAYTPITVGGGATVSTATGDNANQSNIPIGFTFLYGDSTFTTIGISTNGMLWFDFAEPAVATGNINLVTTSAPNQALAPWWNNLMDDASSDILYQTQGAPGSRTFTVQYTNYPTYVGTAGTNVRMNCQVKLYETTNIIEFRYGTLNVTGDQTTSGGAMIGMGWGSGGTGNYIDAVTGSSIVNHRMLAPLAGWPSYNFRFAPGIPAAIAAGTYNVGVGQTYNSLTQAVADVNHRGIAGTVTLNLTDAQYDTTAANGSNIFPIFVATPNSDSTNRLTIAKTGNAATLAYRGSNISASGAGWGTGVSTTALGHGSEPILAVCASYTTVNNINLITHGTAPQTVEIGLAQFELFFNKGAQHNFYDKISIDLDRNKGDVYGIASFSTTSPGGSPGTNSFNTWRDIKIKDCNAGFYLQGANTATGPADFGNQIISSSCSTFNYIGDSNVANDIIASGTYGILVTGQADFVVRNCIIQNITGPTYNTIDGIRVTNSWGSNEISNNVIRNIRRSSTTLNSAHFVNGIGFSWDNQPMSYKVFNNSISNLLVAYTGAVTNTAAVVGINFQSNTGTVTTEINNNSISIDGSSFPNASSTCLSIASIGENFQIKNNVFANFTGAQTGVAYHSCFNTNAPNYYGNSLSLSNYNNFFVADTARGYIGKASTNYYQSLGAWQGAMTLNAGTDANSQVANPNFVNIANDLHPTPASTSLDATGTVPPVYVNTDLDCKPRTAPHDIGCYWAGCWAEGGVVAPSNVAACAQQTYTMTASGFASYPGIAYQWQRASVAGGPYTNVAGGSGATTTSYTTGALATGTYYYVLKVTCPDGLTDYSNELTMTVTALPNANITAGGSTTFCVGDSVVLNAVSAANRTYQWRKGSANIVNATGNTYYAKQSGSYKVVVTNTTTGCTKVSPTAIVVTANPLPIATITAAGPTSFCNGDSVMLQANTGVGLSYAWKKGANLIPGATSQNYTAKTAGSYKVQVTNSNGCVKTSAGVNVSIICREGNTESTEAFYMYPNPASDVVYVSLNNFDVANTVIELYNSTGQLVGSVMASHNMGLNMAPLANGLYTVKVYDLEQTARQTIVVQK